MINSTDTIGFMFSKTEIKCNKTHKCSCVCDNNDDNKYKKIKICIFKLEKDFFISSTLGISTNYDEAWLNFTIKIIDLINEIFTISVTKCNILHSFHAQLIKTKYCKCCDTIHLHFKYNFVPISNTCSSSCIQINGEIPNKICMPNNYWPDTNDLIQKSTNNGNFVYDNLDSGIYTDIKFYYDDLYCSNICFINT